LRFDQAAHLLRERGIGADAHFFELLNFRIEAVERFPNGQQGCLGEVGSVRSAPAEHKPSQRKSRNETKHRQNVLRHALLSQPQKKMVPSDPIRSLAHRRYTRH
jgi:hypothetical protein